MTNSNYAISEFHPKFALKDQLDRVCKFRHQVKAELNPSDSGYWEQSPSDPAINPVRQRWVAYSTIDNHIVGYAELTIQAGPDNLCRNYASGSIEVSAEHRRNGIGSTLFLAMMKYANSKDIGHIQLTTTTHSGHAFCQSFGGTEVSEYILYSGRIRDIKLAILNDWIASYNGPPVEFEFFNELPEKYRQEYNALAVEILNQSPVGQGEDRLTFTSDNIDSFFPPPDAINAGVVISVAKDIGDRIVGVSRKTYNLEDPKAIHADFAGIKAEYRNSGLEKHLNAKVLMHLIEHFTSIEYERTLISAANVSDRSIREKLGYTVCEIATVYKVPIYVDLFLFS